MKKIEELSKEEFEKQYIKEMKEFASKSVILNDFSTNSGTYSTRNLNKNKIDKMLQSPESSYKQLQEMSDYLYTINGIYKQLINYQSTLPTFYGNITPKKIDITKKINKKKMLESYYNASLYLDKLNLKQNLPYISMQLWKHGEIYLYELENEDSFLLVELPTELCRTYKDSNNGSGSILRYQINLDLLDENNLASYPREFQIAYTRYKNDKSRTISNWYLVSDKGVVFNLNKRQAHGIPPLACLFVDLADLDNIKQLKKQVDRLENLKMIHFKTPTDKDGKPTMDLPVSTSFVNAARNGSPDGTFIIANPFDPSTLTFANNNTQQKNLERDAVNSIYKNSGTSDMLFSNEKSSSEALKRSIIVDTQYIYQMILPDLSAYINSKLLKGIKDKNKITWKFYFINSSWQGIDDLRKEAFKELATGGSRFDAQVLTGKTPLESSTILYLEDVLKVDDTMKPQINGHNQTEKGDKGRPKNSDNGESISDSTEVVNENG